MFVWKTHAKNVGEIDPRTDLYIRLNKMWQKQALREISSKIKANLTIDIWQPWICNKWMCHAWIKKRGDEIWEHFSGKLFSNFVVGTYFAFFENNFEWKIFWTSKKNCSALTLSGLIKDKLCKMRNKSYKRNLGLKNWISLKFLDIT